MGCGSGALGIILVNLATMAWASNAALGRWLRADIGPLTLTALRFSVATAVLGLILRKLPAKERRYGADRWWLLAMGFCGVVFFSPLLYLGLHYSTAVNSSLIQGFSPLITALIAGVMIQEPVTRKQLVAALIGLIGVAGLISRGSLTYLLQLHFNPGDLMLALAAIIWAFYSVIGRRVMRNRSPASATALSNLLVLPLLWVAALVELQYVPFNVNLGTVLAVAHICIVPTIVGYWSWNRAVGTLGAGGAMVFYNMLPLYGTLFGAVFLGEELGSPHFIFGGLILVGGLWATLGKRGS